MKKIKLVGLILLICLLGAFKTDKHYFSANKPALNGNILFTDSTGFDAVLSTYQSVIMGKNHIVLPYLNLNVAFFYNQQWSPGLKKFFQANSVSINDSTLFFNKGGYVDTFYRAYPSPISWKVVGSASVTSFTFTNNNPIPSYGGYNSLPDTLFNNQDITVSVSNFSNADKVQVWLQNSDNNQTIKRTIDNSGTVTFSQTSDLVGFYSQNAKVSIVICLSNYNIQTISGKKINFINNYSLVKNVFLINGNITSRVKK